MSAKVMGRVWDYQFDHAETLVLLAMADHADHAGGNVFPSVTTVAWKTGYSEAQARRIIQRLEKKGILVPVEERPGRSTVYRIDFTNATPKSEKKAEQPLSKCDPLQNDTPVILQADPAQNDTTAPIILIPPYIIEPSFEPSEREDAHTCAESDSFTDADAPVPPLESEGGGKASQQQRQQKRQTTDDAAKELLAAYRDIRYPGKPSFSATEWKDYRAALNAMVQDRRTAEDVRAATTAALVRWPDRGMVNPNSVARHMDGLLEPATPPRASPNGNGHAPPRRRNEPDNRSFEQMAADNGRMLAELRAEGKIP